MRRNDSPRTHTTWYETLQDPGDIAASVHWALARPGIFLNTVGDLSILPHVLEAANDLQKPLDDDAMRAMLTRNEMLPLFV